MPICIFISFSRWKLEKTSWTYCKYSTVCPMSLVQFLTMTYSMFPLKHLTDLADYYVESLSIPKISLPTSYIKSQSCGSGWRLTGSGSGWRLTGSGYGWPNPDPVAIDRIWIRRTRKIWSQFNVQEKRNPDSINKDWTLKHPDPIWRKTFFFLIFYA